ncbi:MAG: TRAP transporter small permease subunit, partial [Paracoccaceae bacterium]|nr:TRAP transporter small permease subunit [Paracoccaceae bacterium]
MTVLFGVLWPLQRINDLLLAVGRWLAIAALGIMVCLILSQIFFRYVLDSPLNWTEEAARFGMLWMTGLMAPLAYRIGGFVAIDMAERGLGRTLSALLTIFLLAISLAVIIICLDKGINNHVDSLTGRGKSS